MISEIITGIVIILIFLAIGYFILISSNKLINKVLRRSKSQVVFLYDIKTHQKINPKLQQKLVDMVQGNVEEAERLIAKARFGKHGRSENYYLWRAIQDLQSRRR